MLYKTCSNCKKSLPEGHYYKDKQSRSGLTSQCKQCQKDRLNKPENRYAKYKKDAKRRGLKFALSEKYFKSFENKDCHYCGEKFKTIRLDRIDNDRGYIVDNVVSCCFTCNSLKHVFDVDFFLNHINKIYTYQNRKNDEQQKNINKKFGKEDPS